MSAVLRAGLPPSWQRGLLPFGLVLVAVLLLYRQTGESMVSIWARSETFAHAFVVPPIALWLVWRKRAELARLSPRPAPWMLLPMAGAAFVWLLGDLVVANSVTQVAFIAMLVLAVPAVLGWAVARVLLFPLAFLFFAAPVGEALTPTMMQWTSDFTVFALRASGIPVYREGLQFVIPTGSWSVVEACSGLRYLMASFMVGSLFAYLNYRSWRRRVAFTTVSILLPIVANWVRAYMIVMLGHLSGNKLAVGADHLVYGWVFFGIVILGLFFIGARWSEPELPLPPMAGGDRAAPGRSAMPVTWAVAAAALALLLLPQLALSRLDRTGEPTPPVLALPGTLAGGWVAGAEPISDWKPIFVEASAEAQATYQLRNERVGVLVAYYRNQTETRKLVGSQNTLVAEKDADWNQLRQGQLTVPIDAGEHLSVHTAELLGAARPGQIDRQRLQVWRLFWVGGHVTDSEVKAKLYSAWERIRGQGDESAAVIVYAADVPEGTARPVLDSFLRVNFRSLDRLLRAVAHPRPEP